MKIPMKIPTEMSEVRAAFLMLQRDDIEDPEKLRLPVGSCVHVMSGCGFTFDGVTWKPQTGYILGRNLEKLQECVEDFPGFSLRILKGADLVQPIYEIYYPCGDPVSRVYMPGMTSIGLAITDIDLAKRTLETRHDIPVCPVCDDWTRYTTDLAYAQIYDTASKYFTYYWVYGNPLI